MAKKGARCGKCVFRAKPLAQHTCDYFAITGHTRKAVPPEKCRNFREGERIDPERKGIVIDQSPPLESRKRAPGGGAKPKYDWAKARKLYEQGLNDGEIGRAIGCGCHAVFSWRKKNNLPANTAPGGRHEQRREGKGREGKGREGKGRRRSLPERIGS